jgi:hypothetical protein
MEQKELTNSQLSNSASVFSGPPNRHKLHRKRGDPIIEPVHAGGTGTALAERFGISVQSIQNIKEAAGLERQRAKWSKFGPQPSSVPTRLLRATH